MHFKCSKSDEKYLNNKQQYIRSVTLSKTSSNKYYLSILIDYQQIKYEPSTKTELQELVKDESVYLGDIDTSLITDMSNLIGMFRM